jgi:Antitoxin VbhA
VKSKEIKAMSGVIATNAWMVENAIAQQRLEGLEPSHEVISDLEQVAKGKISIDDVIANIGKRFRDGQILRP